MLDLLDKEHHANLIGSLDYITEQTNVPIESIRSVRAKDHCSEEEMVWLRDIKKYTHNPDSSKGMIFTGFLPTSNPMKKCCAIGATLIRNSIDARIYTLPNLIEMLAKGKDEEPDCTVLIIPDLCIEGLSMSLAKWQLSKLYSYLLFRYAHNKITIAYVDRNSSIDKAYGRAFDEFLRSHYSIFTAETALA